MRESSRGLGRALTEVVLETGQRVVGSARQSEQLSDLRATMKAVMFFLCTMEPLSHASNLTYLPFWQNVFSAEKVAEIGRANGVY